MATQLKSVDGARVYTGPIFDADTHFWETPDACTAYMSGN